MRIIIHAIMVIGLTLLTQIGGVIWILSRFLPKYKKTGFITIYIIASIAITFIAPFFGRVRLPILNNSLHAASPIYWMFNRNFVTPELHNMLIDMATPHGITEYPDGIRYLDASFPFGSMPLLPHLSHNDGKKVDLAFYYQNDVRRTDKLRSPVGYFAFEYPDIESCPPAFPTLRWNLDWLQPFWRRLELDDNLTRDMLNRLKANADKHNISKVFIEPHLKKRLDVSGDIFRFQGCRAARHDDHIHVQIR